MKKVVSKSNETPKSEISLAIWGNDLVLRTGLPGDPSGPFIEFYREIEKAFPQVEFILDEKRQILRCLPIHFSRIQSWLLEEVGKNQYANLKLDFDPKPLLDFEPKITLTPRSYQTE